MTRHEVQNSRVPLPLVVATAAWGLFGILQLVVASGIDAPSSRTDEVDRIRDELGAVAVGMSDPSTSSILTAGVGLAMIAATLFLLAGRSWTRAVLGLLGVVGIVLLGGSGRIEVVLAIGLFLVGIVGLMIPASHRYLGRPRTSR